MPAPWIRLGYGRRVLLALPYSVTMWFLQQTGTMVAWPGCEGVCR